MKDNAELLTKVKAAVGDQAIGSAEDLVVAVCQTVLLQYGNGLTRTATTDWSVPRLPQTHRVASYGSSIGTIEVKWIAMGDSHVMMLLSRANSASGVQTIQLQTSSVVRSAVTFPLKLDEQGQPLADGAASRVSAAICTPLTLELTGGEANETTGDNRPIAAFPAAAAAATQPPPQAGNRRDDDSTTIAAPAEIGRDDLNPLGTRGVPPFGGASDAGSEGGGMVVGPGHPLFRCEFDTRGAEDDSEFRDPSILPPGAVPPGARFDPIGPFGQMPGPGHPQRGRGRGRGGGPDRFFSGEPDPDVGQLPKRSWNFYF